MLFFCLPLLCFSSLEDVLKNPQFDWMDIQIAHDLSYFRDKNLTSNIIEETLQDILEFPDGDSAELFLYTIENNQVRVESFCSVRGVELPRPVNFVKTIQSLAQIVGLPDMRFLVSSGDSFDRPSFLQTTTVPIFCIAKKRK